MGDLERLTVYRLRVRLVDDGTPLDYSVALADLQDDDVLLPPNFDDPFEPDPPVFDPFPGPELPATGSWSEWNYVITRPDDLSGLSGARFRTVARALAEIGAQRGGEVGPAGLVDVNGRRYTSGTDARWCSEFYAWAAAPDFPDLAGHTGVRHHVAEFSSYHAFLAPELAIGLARPGDYLGWDWGIDGEEDHSSMFLAVEPFVDGAGPNLRVWGVDGNWGNQVVIRSQDIGTFVHGVDKELFGIGLLSSAMLP